MNVLLTNSYFYQLDPKQWRNRTPYPPLATITALSYLRTLGFQPDFYDVSLDSSPENAQNVMRDSQPDVVVIYEDGFNYLTKMCLTSMREACFELIATARTLGARVIVSSSDATDQYALYHEKGADVVIHGEAEISLGECLTCYQKGETPELVEGISYRMPNGACTKTAARLVKKDLDDLPDADWTAVDIPAYRSIWSKSKFPFTLNVSTTRGCPFKCNWCAKPIYGNRYNSRSPERVVNEIEQLIVRYNVTHFWITDDIFGLKPGWVKRFNELVQEKQLRFHYKIQSRADLLLKEQTIAELAASGLEEAWIGAESGSQKILDAMDKGITTAQIAQSTQALQEHGVRVAYFLQFGYLGETREDIYKTIRMLTHNQPDDIGISVSYPLPGTPFYDRVHSEMTGKKNWVDSDDLDLMFSGTYGRDFYRKLQRYVHHLFRYQQGTRFFQNKRRTALSWRYFILLPYNFIASRYLQSKLK